jgi:predicted DNA-binding transcriptional regulator AlpA
MEHVSGDDRLITLSEVESIVSFGKTWIYGEIKARRFPPPIKFGSSSRWSERRVKAWVATKSQAVGEQ